MINLLLRSALLRSGGPGVLAALLSLVAVGCGPSETGPDGGEDEMPIPPPGPFFSVSPIPTDKIARITAFGHQNKILPTPKVYVDTCDYGITGRPCTLERVPIRAPGDGVVQSIDAQQDGKLSIEGPPGLILGFAHVTPHAGLTVGDSVHAGDPIATMYYHHSFDFSLVDYGVTNDFINKERVGLPGIHGANPLGRYSEPLRSELLGLVHTAEDPLGEVVYDIAGTASGAWYLEGTPDSDLAATPDWAHTQLFLGPLAELREISVVVTGTSWGGFRIAAAEASFPSWKTVTPASGPVQVRLFELGFAFDIRPFPTRGSLLVEMLDTETLRLEWFDTHEEVTAFSEAASVYER